MGAFVTIGGVKHLVTLVLFYPYLGELRTKVVTGSKILKKKTLLNNKRKYVEKLKYWIIIEYIFF